MDSQANHCPKHEQYSLLEALLDCFAWDQMAIQGFHADPLGAPIPITLLRLPIEDI